MGAVPAQLADPDAAAPNQAAGRRLRRWATAAARPIWNPSPAAMRGVALAGLITSVAIILSGAAVRLSQSGLGCPDWPACTSGSLGATGVTGDPLIHRWIEFGNRLVTVAIFVIAVLVFVAAWRFSARGGQRRRDLVWLAAAQPAFIVVQAVIGGLVVLTHLSPALVSVHFLASSALVAAAVGLYIRGQEGSGPARPLVSRLVRLVAAWCVAAVALVLAAGTVVTGTGPLAGAGSVPRYSLPLEGVTQLHADIGWLLGGLVIGLVVALRLSSAPQRARRLGWVLLALIGLQGVIGYAQYFSGLPAGLVWVHVAGSTAIWVVALLLPYALRERAPGPVSGPPRVTPLSADLSAR